MSISITRITPDTYQAIKAFTNATDLMNMAGAMEKANTGYHVALNCSIARVEITPPGSGSPEQFANPGDWLVITNATVDNQGNWTVQPTSRILVYSDTYTDGIAGTVTDFRATFTGPGLN